MNIKKSIQLFLGFYFLALLFGCAATKPNIPYPGPYPSSFNELLATNPLLVQELGKLPEIQDGISESEATALDHFVRIYNNNKKLFDKAFQEMYQVGLPEVRKYCTPLQALYWLVEDGKIDELHPQIHNYSLKNLLDSSWKFNGRFELEVLELSEQKAQEIVDALNKDVIWYAKYQETAKDVVKLCYNRNPNDIPRKYRELIENGNNYKITKVQFNRNNLRWKDYNIVIDRLNAPKLIEYYSRIQFTWVDYRTIPTEPPRMTVSPKYVFKYRKGNCVAITDFIIHCLRRGGYKAYELTVPDQYYAWHSLCIFEKNGKKYLMDNGRPRPRGILPYSMKSSYF